MLTSVKDELLLLSKSDDLRQKHEVKKKSKWLSDKTAIDLQNEAGSTSSQLQNCEVQPNLRLNPRKCRKNSRRQHRHCWPGKEFFRSTIFFLLVRKYFYDTVLFERWNLRKKQWNHERENVGNKCKHEHFSVFTKSHAHPRYVRFMSKCFYFLFKNERNIFV